MYEVFKSKIAAEKKLRRLKNKDIAQMTGYAVTTINQFMGGIRDSEKVARAISAALDIPLD